MSFRPLVAVAAATGIMGCATIMHQTTQKIGISSTPTGATVSVDNRPYGTTPVFADLKRNTIHIVTIEMPGYEKAQLTLTNDVSGWVWGNIVFGGLIGFAVDALSGGLYTLSPEQLNAEMRKADIATISDGIAVVATLVPDPLWQKVGSLQPE